MRNTGQKWPMEWIHVQTEKDTRGQAAGPAQATGRRETRRRLNGS